VSAVCDLSQVVGYTLVFGKTVPACIQGGKRVADFEGCTRDRLLVFTDNTGSPVQGDVRSHGGTAQSLPVRTKCDRHEILCR
jgi:hypothetical protein